MEECRGHISCMEIVGSHHQLKGQFRFNRELGLFSTDKRVKINVRENRTQRECVGNIIFNQLIPHQIARKVKMSNLYENLKSEMSSVVHPKFCTKFTAYGKTLW